VNGNNTMKHVSSLILAAVIAFATPAALAESAADIIAASDRVRNPDKSFRMIDTLTDFTDGKPVSQTTLIVASLEDKTTKRFSSIVRFAAPARDEGKMVMMDEGKMWFYDPASKASVRLSPQQRLSGQASNGDVVSTNFARDYTSTLVGEETLKDADRKDRTTWHLDLKASTDEAVYGRVEYWIEKGTFLPVKGKFYADSGRLLKSAYYHKVEQQLGADRPTETIIIDAVDPKQVTRMTYTDYRFQDVKREWFQRDALPNLKLD